MIVMIAIITAMAIGSPIAVGVVRAYRIITAA